MPILQIGCAEGLIAPGNKILQPADTALAVLHPRRLVIAAIVTSSSFSVYKEIYTHDFKRNLFNFTVGILGGKTTICVQSVDGALFFVR